MGPWLWLGLAGLAEIGFAVAVKASDGFTRPGAVALTLGAMVVSLFCMSRAMQALPMGTVYAVWTGIGAAGALAWGILVGGEPAGALRLLCILLILAGVAGIRWAS